MTAARGSLTSNEAWLAAIQRTAHLGRRPERTLAVLVREMAQRTPQAPALLSAGERLTYAVLAERIDRYRRWAVRQRLGRGDVVALLMASQPDYVAIWLGIAQSGATVALLNTNLAEAAILHCLQAAGARTIVTDAAFAGVVPAAGFAVWAHGSTTAGRPRIDTHTEGEPNEQSDVGSDATLDDRALYIYTSGTTGLPKAASVSHHRIMQWAEWFAGMGDFKSSDRTYNCLPLYHSVGGVVAIGAALAAGGSVFIRDGFSARQFWSEVAAEQCTVFQYIGELCRYLLNAPADPAAARHALRLACGNGLKGDIWAAFKDRFAIPQILEFYASTEGSFSLFNYEQQPGAIGRIPGFVGQARSVALIEVDGETGGPVRDLEGRCRRVPSGQSGEAIGRLAGAAVRAGERFEGYADTAASERKILRDVFAPGDAWYRSGDLMRKDDMGFFYFADRIGDTFRWKGENVSTTEVTAVVRSAPGVLDADVYGVPVPGTDGKAGMAAIVTGPGFDLAGLHGHIAQRLPSYARPLFLRLRAHLDRTSTFKADKQRLQREGFDPELTADPIYLDHAGYLRLDREVMQSIRDGAIRF